jgi:hypothetical protein
MSGHRPEHVRGFGTPTTILVVQEKPDCPVSKIGLSSFVGLKPQDRPYPFTVFLISLSLTIKNNYEGDPKTPFGDS